MFHAASVNRSGLRSAPVPRWVRRRPVIRDRCHARTHLQHGHDIDHHTGDDLDHIDDLQYDLDLVDHHLDHHLDDVNDDHRR